VPLSPASLALVKAQAKVREGDFVFAGGRRGRGLSNMAMAALLKRMKRKEITVHGFRSTFKDWCSEQTNSSNEVSEMALAHAVGDKVEAAYRRGDLFAKRAQLMHDWARFLRGRPQRNTPFRTIHPPKARGSRMAPLSSSRLEVHL
jgi:integrase